MVNLGFKQTLLLAVSLIIALSVGSSNYFSYNEFSHELTNTIYQSTEERIKVEAEKLEAYIQAKTHAVEKLADDYQQHQYQTGHAERMRIASHGADVFALMIGFANGDAYTSANYDTWIDNKNPPNYDPRKRPWYQEAIRTSGSIFTQPYTGASTGLLMVSIGKNSGNGVILADITLEILSQTVSDINMKGAIAMIMTEDNTVLASSSPVVKTGKKLTDYSELSHISREVLGTETNTTDYELNGTDKVMFSKKINYGDKSWYLLIGLDKSVVFSKLSETKNTATLLTITYVVLSTLITLLVLTFLYRPILALKETILGLSNGHGDLTHRLEINSNDDLGHIAKGVNSFVEHIHSLIIDIDRASKELKHNVSELELKSNENTAMLDHHVQETELVVTAIEEMSATANTVAQNASDAAQSTQQAAQIGVHSLEVVTEAQSKVSELVSDMDKTANSLQAMSDETKSINSILNVIGDIAEQTNLLALNAAIEAARAGEYGRGFAVVADEVRALASRTQNSTSEIEQALTKLVSGNDIVVKAMESTKSNCDEAYHNTDKVNESINKLSTHVHDITGLTMQIATAAEEQSSVTHEVSQNMNALNGIVNQLNRNSEEASSQTENITHVNEKLASIVNQFKLQ
ncbi:chemotaxis protein [Marinomonas sp. SBI22]|uniref:methyl-accepting chemotaxis protein n=1 Tax=unclassified Marinomonas TaxID=196814 RepID=UPI0007AF2FB7|nr:MULTISPECIES: methyl-accepting chemotaxis protein [unclassified Marinomonas]KZM45916.1 chemotaxis protein [Marinomonas sp. SBI22]KZM46434.1 chemotaxis protein [Marinomonas sp. SBI8L]